MSDQVATTAPATPKKRYIGIDVMRFLVVLPIIAAHMMSRTTYDIGLVSVVDNIGRFVVPFFFLTSGFFLGRKDPQTWPAIAYLTSRLLPIFLFWLVIYLLAFNAWPQLSSPFFVLKCLYYGGPAFHLWFLPSLGISAAIILLTRPMGLHWMLTIGVTLYAIALVTYPYAQAIGIDKPSLATLTGPFPGVLLTFFGYQMGKMGEVPPLKTAWIFFFGGMALQLMEAYFILSTGLGPFAPHLFLIGTIPLGIGAFALALHMKPFKGSNILADLGKIALGMYCSHILFVRFFTIYFDKSIPWQAFEMFVVVLACSIAVSWIMSKTVLKRVVS